MTAGALETISDELELEESGQLTIGVPGEQRALEGLATGTPAPIAPEGFFGAEEELDRRRLAETAEELGEEVAELEEPPAKKPRGSNLRTYRCACCGRKLTAERWVYSRHTNARYCVPGEGCQTPAAYTKQERARERVRKEA